ncbi:uncharacterized protein [Onthophagus taurus]|uniref:uncharacterized protein n=1 Tax=Onthophagus taurus TaxID=166361 RepID=UPI0039BE913F
MYRQIRISKEDEPFQRILWRFNTSEPIQEYKLMTVTYGTTAAPYLAVKTLQQLAQDERSNFPEASKVVLEDFYVDDVLSGADSITEAQIVRKQLNEMLKIGGFLLRKWTCNKPELLQSIPISLRAQADREIAEDWLTKSLGVYWAPLTDTFRFQVNVIINENPTKRHILSEVAKLFDPLGWLAPVVIKAKILIQELWLQELEWDQSVPDQVKHPWLQFQEELKALEEINLPRWIKTRKGSKVELHGFCDASEKAYGAVIYARCPNENGKITSTLVIAKSKVAPARTKSTLPRLELCAAVLLARLFKRTTRTLKLDQETPLFAWSDSTITLAWIKGDPAKWKTFVTNRVVEINNTISKEHWRHVSGEENPADIISRGIHPEKLVQHQVWWNGPSWLLKERCWPQQEEIENTNEEMKIPRIIACVKAIEIPKEYERFSSLTKMIRVLSYYRRFITNCSNKAKEHGPLTVHEMNKTLNAIIIEIQNRTFEMEIKSLRKNNQIKKVYFVLAEDYKNHH